MLFFGIQKGIFYKPNGVKLANYLESLGPIFTKFGQLLSTRTDILDVETAKDLESLTDSCLLYTSPSPRDKRQSRMPSSA